MQEISPEDFRAQRHRYTLVDVREEAERRVASVEGAMAIPLGELEGRYGEIPRDKPIVMMCASGNRSARAVHFLASKGIQAINLKGGITALLRQA